MRTIIRNNYTPHIGDYHDKIVHDEEKNKLYLFDCDGVFTDVSKTGVEVVNEKGQSRVAAVSQKLFTDEIDSKQDTLIAGRNITIEGNVISATGGGGGTGDYNDLENLPQINSHVLIGNKTAAQLGLQPAGNYVTDANYVHTDNNFTTAEKNKLSGLSNYDDTEVKNDIADLQTEDVGIKNRLDNAEDDITELEGDVAGIQTGKQDKLTAGTNITIVDNVISASGSGAAVWGTITGTLTNQTDLRDALDAKQATLTPQILEDLIEGEGDITVDVNSTDDALVIGTHAKTVTITAPTTATEGTLTEEQLAALLESTNSVIVFNNEIYKLNDNGYQTGYKGYSHIGVENGVFMLKNITVTLSTRGWVLTTEEVSDAVVSVNGKTGAVVLNAGDIMVQNAQTIQQNLERIDEELGRLEDDKQNKLTAGQNITIVNDVISATASASVSNHTLFV